mmetsp:Transcript_50129/g.93809  ORF Transcript_50129/g.93809 Transcript_50129/m.93809 type:complete len:674 (+) Transcript_50129:79-2100(+)
MWPTMRLPWTWWSVFLFGLVNGRGDLKSCPGTFSHTDAEPVDTVGRALAQLKFHAASSIANLSQATEFPQPAQNLTEVPHPAQNLTDSQQNLTSETPGFSGNRTFFTGENQTSLTVDDVPPKEPKLDDPLQELPVPGHEKSAYGEEGEGMDEEAFAKHVLIPVATAILLALFLGRILEKFNISFLPESATTLFLGMCLGYYMREHMDKSFLFSRTRTDALSELVGEILTLGLLPILMFDAGWNLRKRDFASQFQYILLYAIGGSLASFAVVGCLILWSGRMGFHQVSHPRTAFAYASLIAATDPVATLGTYASLKVDPLLNTLVFGDSTFNDAVAIVLFKILNNNEIMRHPGTRPSFGELSFELVSSFCYVFFGSVIAGILMGIFMLILIRVFDMRGAQRLLILSLIVSAYIAFSTAEVLGMSGIIATVFYAMMLGVHARYYLPDGGSLLADFFVKQLATLMDQMVFLLAGFCAVALVTIPGSSFGVQIMIFALIGRFAGVYPMTILSNIIKRRVGRACDKPEEDWHLISQGTAFMMWHAALRGGISLTLCMQLGEWVDQLDGPGTSHILQTGTFLVICVFLLVFGGTTEFFLKKLGIPIGEEKSRGDLWDSEAPESLKRRVGQFDEKVFTPFFLGDPRKLAYHQQNLSREVEDLLRMRVCPGSPPAEHSRLS